MRCRILASTLLLALSTGVSAGQVYRWVDAEGITHFGSQPPEGQVAQPISTVTRTYQPGMPVVPDAPAADAEQERIDREVKGQVAAREAELKQYCETLRTNLAQLKNNPRVRVEENGEMRRLGEEERQARIGETEHRIDTDCR
ncbi:DUF4124 domain-containing protein [Stutzerimonas azotifigens]|uniref:DUF4124 domain-containing protein n=1 Tax=Stutzerimonas azotifigens TaxID=291995 RepID=UPI0003FE8235|nr:DUF4124 domain-containing protein [Stutzerimonas azotifigens]